MPQTSTSYVIGLPATAWCFKDDTDRYGRWVRLTVGKVAFSSGYIQRKTWTRILMWDMPEQSHPAVVTHVCVANARSISDVLCDDSLPESK